MTTLVWFRQDLRLTDNPALTAACARGAIVPIYIFDETAEADWNLGGAQRWWLHQSLQALDKQLRQCDARLVIRQGDSLAILQELLQSSGADAVYWNRRYEPTIITRDSLIKETLKTNGFNAESFNGSLLNEPWIIKNQSGKPFQVFTPYWRHCLKLPDPEKPAAIPKKIQMVEGKIGSESLNSLQLLPRINWYSSIATTWQPGEIGAESNLKGFLRGDVWHYTEQRNLPAIEGTSQLSPHLHFGEISPRQIWHALKKAAEKSGVSEQQWRTAQFLTEVYWREFAYHLLFHFKFTPMEPLRGNFVHFPWIRQPQHLRAWQRGKTGIPLVDAGMRQLWTTGWMHNRVRMVVGSFLVKNLLLPWQEGARWFWDTLVDADLASNTLGWQWCAGCGADAAPYFRIFNPVSQGEKFDPDGQYISQWVPELAQVPPKYIHAPWLAPAEILTSAGVRLGQHYPQPIVDLKESRQRALDAYQKIRSTQ
jgi:deoxyribodipyrimidine photo-lyase